MSRPFALWLTGLPASGKSTIAAALLKRLKERGVEPAVLESDVFRRFFTPHATYSEAERVLFYEGLVHVGEILVARDVPVIFDATANRRAYRDKARERFPAFVEVYVDCPLETCIKRDPKGIYKKGQSGDSRTVPGLQTDYEPPRHPEIHIRSDREDPDRASKRILDYLVDVGLVPARRARAM